MAKAGRGSEIDIVDSCIVERRRHDGNGNVIAIDTSRDTSRGALGIVDTKIVLAMGTIAPAPLHMSAFKEHLPNVGKRYTGHFMSHLTARVKRSALETLSPLEIGAVYLDGKDKAGYQYHVQTSAFALANPAQNIRMISREYPDAAAAPSIKQLLGSENYVVFVYATLREISEKNPGSWIKRNDEQNTTTNFSLQITPGAEDMHL